MTDAERETRCDLLRETDIYMAELRKTRQQILGVLAPIGFLLERGEDRVFYSALRTMATLTVQLFECENELERCAEIIQRLFDDWNESRKWD